MSNQKFKLRSGRFSVVYFINPKDGDTISITRFPIQVSPKTGRMDFKLKELDDFTKLINMINKELNPSNDEDKPDSDTSREASLQHLKRG